MGSGVLVLVRVGVVVAVLVIVAVLVVVLVLVGAAANGLQPLSNTARRIIEANWSFFFIRNPFYFPGHNIPVHCTQLLNFSTFF